MSTPRKNAAAYDVITLGGVKSPGLCRMPNNPERKTEVDIQGQPGYQGKISIPKGDNLIEVVYLFEIWESAHFAQWKVLRQRLESARVKKPRQEVIVVIDPRLEGLASKFTVIGLSGSNGFQIEPGLWGANVTLLEYRNPIPVPRLPATQSVQDAFKKESEELTAEAKQSKEAALATLAEAKDAAAPFEQLYTSAPGAP